LPAFIEAIKESVTIFLTIARLFSNRFEPTKLKYLPTKGLLSMQILYKWSTLGLATLITVVVSLGCTYWFFYSLLGGVGNQAVGAGIAGCALQIFGYGFAAKFLPINQGLRIVLCAVPLAISMLGSYSTLYGYMAKEKEQVLQTERENKIALDILEQSAKDRELSAVAAEQGIGDKYRTQAKGFLKYNLETRAMDEKLLNKMSHDQSAKATTPLDGLIMLTGDSSKAIILFCVWLAVLFDLLPIMAVNSLLTDTKVRKDSDFSKKLSGQEKNQPLKIDTSKVFSGEMAVNRPSNGNAQSVENNTDNEIKNSAKENESSHSGIEAVHVPVNIKQNSDPHSNVKQLHSSTNAQKDKSSVIQLSDEKVTQALLNGEIEPKYRAVYAYANWKQTRTKRFFDNAVETGLLTKKGARFSLTRPVSLCDADRKKQTIKA